MKRRIVLALTRIALAALSGAVLIQPIMFVAWLLRGRAAADFPSVMVVSALRGAWLGVIAWGAFRIVDDAIHAR